MRRLFAMAAVAALLGCKKDSSGPSGGNVTFPALDAQLVSAFCIRGDRTVGQNVSSSVSSGDCDAAAVDPNDDGYYEVWRIRVASARSVTFTTDGTFDTYLTVIRLDAWDGQTLAYTPLGENDDIDATTLNSRVTVNLQPGADYFVAVAGYDYTEVGSYTMTIN